MTLRNRAKIANRLNSILNINIDRDFVFNVFGYRNFKVLGGITIDTFNSPDTYRPEAIFFPLFIPEETLTLSYGWTMNYYSTHQIDKSIDDMTNEYVEHIQKINSLNAFFNALNSAQIPNRASILHLRELLIYLCLILEKYDELFKNIKKFYEMETSITSRWKFHIIERVKVIEKFAIQGEFNNANNQLLQWQNYTIKMLKLSQYLTVNDSSQS